MLSEEPVAKLVPISLRDANLLLFPLINADRIEYSLDHISKRQLETGIECVIDEPFPSFLSSNDPYRFHQLRGQQEVCDGMLKHLGMIDGQAESGIYFLLLLSLVPVLGAGREGVGIGHSIANLVLEFA